MVRNHAGGLVSVVFYHSSLGEFAMSKNAAFETRYGKITNIFGNKTAGRIRSNFNLVQYRYAIVGNGNDKTEVAFVKTGSGKGATVNTIPTR